MESSACFENCSFDVLRETIKMRRTVTGCTRFRRLKQSGNRGGSNSSPTNWKVETVTTHVKVSRISSNLIYRLFVVTSLGLSSLRHLEVVIVEILVAEYMGLSETNLNRLESRDRRL